MEFRKVAPLAGELPCRVAENPFARGGLSLK
jgi:hypothetical protein